MPTIYLLPSCATCRRVRDTLRPLADWRVRDIKAEPLTPTELDALAERAGGYEPLFSRRAVLYRQRGLHGQALTEADYRRLILEHYTFLKRPVMVVDDSGGGGGVFAGSSKKVVEAAARAV